MSILFGGETMDSTLKALTDLDQKLVQAAKGIKILTTLSWPVEHQTRFLDGWQKKNPRIPRIESRRVNYGQTLADLRQICKQAGRGPSHRQIHPKNGPKLHPCCPHVGKPGYPGHVGALCRHLRAARGLPQGQQGYRAGCGPIFHSTADEPPANLILRPGNTALPPAP